MRLKSYSDEGIEIKDLRFLFSQSYSGALQPIDRMSAEKSSAMSQLIDITECCICLKTFTDPRMLPCIHTFCVQCIQDMADKTDKKTGDALPCPVCRKEFPIPSDGIQGFQRNFFMTSLIEVRNALNQSTMDALSCDICKTNTEAVTAKIPEAKARCLVCKQNLCECCLKLHKTFTSMKNHEILKIGETIEVEEVVKNLQTINCDIHRGRVSDYYCTECKKVVCVSCFVESHRTHDCKDVYTVEEEFRQMIKSNAHKISTLAEELLAKKDKSETKEKFLQKMFAREKEILRRSEDLKEMLDEQTESLLNSLEEIKNQHLKEIQTEEDELERRLTILESFSRYCDELRSKGSASDVCRSKDKLLRRAEELEEDHETYVMRPHVSYVVTFQATDLDNILKTTKGNIIGCLNVYDRGTVFDLSILHVTDDDIIARFLEGVSNTSSLSLAIGYPTLVSVPHSIANGFKNLLALAAATDIEFKQAETLKEFLKDPSKFATAAAAAVPAAAAKLEEKKHEKKEEKAVEDDDFGFGLFD